MLKQFENWKTVITTVVGIFIAGILCFAYLERHFQTKIEANFMQQEIAELKQESRQRDEKLSVLLEQHQKTQTEILVQIGIIQKQLERSSK